MTEDYFKYVQELIRAQEYNQVINIIINLASNRVKAPYSSDLNHAWYLVGYSYLKLDKFEDALLCFKRSYRYWREDVSVMISIAICYSELKKPKVSKYYLLHAINVAGEKHKKINHLRYNLGNAYFDMKMYDCALEEYRKVSTGAGLSYRLARKNIKLVLHLLESKN